jgi:hypothetical protein
VIPAAQENALAEAARRAGQYALAMRHAAQAVRYSPENPTAWWALSADLWRGGQLEEALTALSRGLACNPGTRDEIVAKMLVERAHVLSLMNRCEDALESAQAAVRHDPGCQLARWYGAMMRLAMGDYAQGWREYEVRLRMAGYSHRPQRSRVPLLSPGEAVAGKRVLVWGEQGYGDTLQFVRYVRWLVDRGAEVVLGVAPALIQLFRTSFPGVEVTPYRDAVVQVDRRVGLMSLPYLSGTTVDTVPEAAGYLQAQPERVAHWLDWLGAGRWVGVTWAGSGRHDRDWQRSIPIASFAPLFDVPGVQFVCLQPEVDRSGLPSQVRVPELGDWADTAALLMACEQVVSVDTAVAHLAGGLGQRTTVLLPWAAEWRWMRELGDTPWYRSMRLLRQPDPGNWSAVIERAAEQLAGGRG